MTSGKVNYQTWKTDLLWEAIEKRELDVEAGTDRQDLIAALKLADLGEGKGEGFVVESEDGFEEIDPMDDTLKVIFHNTADNSVPYVHMGHNGKSYYARKEEEILIPKFLLDSCIKDAVETHEEGMRTPEGKTKWVAKKVQRFPYTIVNT